MRRTFTRGERAAIAARRAAEQAETVRELDALYRDDAARMRVLELVGWLW